MLRIKNIECKVCGKSIPHSQLTDGRWSCNICGTIYGNKKTK